MIGAIGALVAAFIVGLIPGVPELAKQGAWLVAIAGAAGWALWDWRRRARAKAERAEAHRRRMTERGTDIPPRLRDQDPEGRD
ncbi:hypothetical protein [uncultured Demequina sp.]|uniref:hypothetical protein n=1 Tax=uncultured Demequina sp. TaxID=693499 RepID=UPI0025E65579|nr:hypothetical protein [uncultured Demequina sp.]